MSTALDRIIGYKRDEVAALSAKSEARAAATVLFQAGLAVAAFALAILWPNPLTILAAIIIAATSMNCAGKVIVPAARLIVTRPSSSG